MATFHTVKEAARLTGKSASSIRRIIYPIIHDDAHADRGHVLPNVEEALQLRMKGENFAWRLSDELLRREVPVDAATDKAATGEAGAKGQADGDLLAMLRRELDIKNNQISQQGDLIARQMELINGLSERLREGNVLMGTLQQRLALPPESRPEKAAINVKPKRAPSPKPEKGSTIADKSAKPKSGWLSRIFR